MAMKPRTFRRVVLLGSLVAFVLVVTVGYFVVRPWMSRHKIEGMRTQGLAAVEAGDYPTAALMLNRYINSSQDVEPDLLLKYARARLKVTSSDGAHISGAVKAYRRYLILVPDDVQAAQELLPLFNMMDMYVEAKSLAQDLRTKHDDQSIETIRQELYARSGLGENIDTLGPLLQAAAEHEDARFGDLLGYTDWLRSHDQKEEAQQFLDERLARTPDSMSVQLVRFWVSVQDMNKAESPDSNARVIGELSGILGLDPETGAWTGKAGEIDPSISNFADRLLNAVQRPDLSLALRIAAAQGSHDTTSAVWAARRLYWSGQKEKLYALDVQSEEGESLPDVVGYQILAAKQAGDDERLATLNASLDSIKLDFRARVWRGFLDAMAIMDSDTVKARPMLQEAIDKYPSEPTFHQVMGSLKLRHGRLSDAKDEWVRANQLANGDDYDRGQVGPVGWVDPLVRIIDAYSRANRLSEATEYLQDLVRVSPRSTFTNNLVLQAFASLARSNTLAPRAIRAVLDQYELQQASYPAEYKAVIAPQIATLYASILLKEQAAQVIGEALDSAMGEGSKPALLAELLEVDQHYQLGLAKKAGLDSEKIAGSTPQGALRYALDIYQKTQDVEQGLKIIDRGASEDGEDDSYTWALTRARYLDTTRDDRALAAWDKLREEHPDDIALLYEIAESNAYMNDLAKVNQVIDTIVEKTSTGGDTLPARLRLAQASAMVHTQQTRENKQKALEIVRAVVSAESKNIKARNMLGRLLEMQPDPDYPGAINQYVTLARQIEGRGAQVYLIQAVDLAYKVNDLDNARRYLLEFNTRFPDDYQALPQVARRLVNLNLPDQAIDIDQRIYRNATDRETVINAGLALVDLYFTQGRPKQGQAMLNDLSGLDAFSVDQLLELASQYTRHGDKSEGDRLAQAGQDFGLDESQSRLVYARYAEQFVSEDEYLRVLGEMVEAEPKQAQAWKMLIGKLVRLKRYDEAQQRLAQAKTHIETDDELRSLTVLAQGEPTSVSDLLNQPGFEASPAARKAAKLVDDYNTKAPSQTPEQRIAMLGQMLDEMPDFVALQTFALSELSQLPIDPKLLAQHADRAARSNPGNLAALRIGSNAYLRASMPTDAIRLARVWRANARGSTIEPDVVTAQAMTQMGDFAQSGQVLEPYVAAAIQKADLPISQELLFAYSQAKLLAGEEPDVTAARLAPLLADHPAIRTRVWLNLAVVSVPNDEDGADWISTLTPYAQPDEMDQIAGAWVSLANRHEAWVPRYAQGAIDILEPSLDARNPQDPAVLGTLAQAYTILARGTENPDQKKQAFARASSYLVRAGDLDPSNLAYLIQAASIAAEAQDFSQAESHYRALLGKQLPAQLEASFKNNLALVMERLYTDDSKLNEALGLVKDAIDTIDAATFWGTRGWVELALKQDTQAEESFRHAIGLEDANPEGWAGLAISLSKQGQERAEEAQQALGRVRGFASQGQLDAELRRRLRVQGLEE